MKTSFIDHNFKYAKAFVTRNYEELGNYVLNDKDKYSFYIEEGDSLVAYAITKNEPVSELYGFDAYVVRFYFSNFDSLHDEKQEKNCMELTAHLKQEMLSLNGYFNLRIPTHIVDLIRACNANLESPIICGGTVEEYIRGKSIDIQNNDLEVFMADEEYINVHKEELMNMTYDSFKSYQGQYHLSPVTSFKAGLIYERWIAGSLTKNSNDKIIVAQYKDIPVGFVTISEDDFAVDGILSAVDLNNRKLGAYKAMITYIINYANSQGKTFITSTQFDNFIVQGTWNSLGLKPFYSIYNVHYDYRH